MPTVKDELSDGEAEALEQAQRRDKRSKTKYGSGVNGSTLDATEDDDE